MPKELPKEFLDLVNSITAKRPRTVIQHILEHGQITTEELKDTYGYDHPPRAARDVREQGILLKTIRVRGTNGRMIGAYIFDESFVSEGGKLGGRTAISKDFKNQLIAANGEKCGICGAALESRYLQVDHRIPYQVAGDQAAGGTRGLGEYMLLCGSCNRSKSWSCEHCPNWTGLKSPDVCKTCYWADTDAYVHIATKAIRRLDIVWNENEVKNHDSLVAKSDEIGVTLKDLVKSLLVRALTQK